MIEEAKARTRNGVFSRTSISRVVVLWRCNGHQSNRRVCQEGN
jgi:hypothetical protein